jgi:salicylate hydroxylase
MAPSRTILISGAGIGGLTAALAVANAGFRVVILEQAARLEETGAGLQLGPNATRLLIELGLRERLEPVAVAPDAIRIRHALTGADIALLPLGDRAVTRFGAPYWALHRADLQAALADAATAHPDIEIKLNCRVEDFATHAKGITVEARQGLETVDERGVALIGADGLWSAIRDRLGPIIGHRATPQFAQRTAYRALVPADAVAEEWRANQVQLWLGQGAHLVHYPVRGGALINIVAIVHEDFQQPGWTAPGTADDVLTRYPVEAWGAARPVLEAASHWQKWALYGLPPLRRWGKGPVTLLGDAAHPMLPFLAQGAATAIEDAAVLADRLGRFPNDIEAAFRAYEKPRATRTARVQHAARRNGNIYQMTGVSAVARNAAMRVMGGRRLLAGYDWLYGWRPS